MKRLPALLTLFLIATLLPLSLAGSAEAAAKRRAPRAQHDLVVVNAGKSTRAQVKRNDVAYRKRHARVRVLGTPDRPAPRVRLVHRGRQLRVTAPRTTEPGRYRFRYSLVDVQGRRDVASLRVKVRRPRPEPPTTPTTPPTTPPTPPVTAPTPPAEEPTAPPVTPPTPPAEEPTTPPVTPPTPPVTPPTPPTPPSSLPLLDVVPAGEVSSRMGIRDFPHYNTSTYGNRPAIEKALGDLGVDWVSVKYVPTRDDLADLERLHGMGIKTVLTVGETKNGYRPETQAFWDGLTRNLVRWGDDVPMVTGWNEPNHIRGGATPLPADWALRTLRDNMVPLSKAVAAANAQMSHRVRVGTPSLWSGDLVRFSKDLLALATTTYVDGSGKAWSSQDTVDSLSYHLYPRGGDPTWELDWVITTLRLAFPKADRTPWCTEAGYFTAANYQGGAKAVTEEQQAAYTAKMGLEHYLRGGYVSYFEVTDSPDPSDSDREASLGLIDTPSLDPATWRRKPAFDAVSAILSRTGGRATQVHAKVTAPSGVQQLATVDGRGEVLLYLWRRVDVDARGHAAPVQATVTTDSGTRTVAVGGSITTVPLG